jgi:Zn-dependent M28 family amino/carboxypeptidase
VAERRGLRRPDEIYLITAHLDDMPPGGLAPGADDNASGSSAVLIAADLLSQLDFDSTLRFVLFTGEEQGLRGSAAYAADIALAGDDVQGVINLDMIGYDSDAAPTIDLHARSAIPDSLALAETFSQVIAAYDLELTPDILVDVWIGDYSDNKSFWDQGYAAILAIEDEDDFTPYYHTVNDTLQTLDLEYLTEFVRAGVGALAHLANLADTGTLSGQVTNGATGLPLPATVTASAPFDWTHDAPGRVYTTTSDASGYYSLTLQAYTFTLYAQAIGADYQLAVVTNVVVLANETTVRDLMIEPWSYQIFMPIFGTDA